MRLFYNSTGHIVSAVMEKDKSPITVSGYSQFDIDEVASNRSIIIEILLSIMDSTDNYTVVGNQLIHLGQAVVLATDPDRQQIKAEYTDTINTLSTIENTVNPTNAQVISAVKFLAKTVRVMIKLLIQFYN